MELELNFVLGSQEIAHMSADIPRVRRRLDRILDLLNDKLEQETKQIRRLTLTAKGMAILAECGRLPHVEEAEIEDKSKANDLAKATVIVQATWMIVQVVGRLAFRLPVTLLEVNTVAHV